MSTYVLKTYSNGRLLETYSKRSPAALRNILQLPEMHQAGATDTWGEPLNTADTMVIYTARNEKIFSGSISECEAFVRTLR